MADPGRAHTAPRTAVVWTVLRAELDRHPDASLRVLDVGGGSGQFAVPLAELGHQVTVVDASPDALAALERRAAERGVAARITGVQGDADTVLQVVGAFSQDLVLCHSLLEVVEDPAATLAAVAAMLPPRGLLSVLVANRAAAVLSRALGGHFADAERALTDPDGRWGEGDGATRRFDAEGLQTLIAASGLVVEQLHGVRVVADLVPGAVADVAGTTLVGVELALAGRAPYRDIATQLHLLARKP